MKKISEARFTIDVPLDASGVEGYTPGGPVKVAVVDSQGVITAQGVKLDERGAGVARFSFAGDPGALTVLVGPIDAADDELPQLQTISREISARAIRQGALKLSPIVISSYYWHWWRHWCRTFTISGRLVCPDGSPVPGATVCAYDVDWWWWWSSTQQVGCAVTDASGAFKISFRWCCGWLPWWWWRRRFWQLEPSLVERVAPMFELDPRTPMPQPSPRPSLAIFDRLLADGGARAGGPARAEVNPAALEQLRAPLVARLGPSLELEKLRIWPWYRWQPWWDCTPDIIFRATQSCDGQERVIVSEPIWQARWDIAQQSQVTLVSSQEACCIHSPPQPHGNCLLISDVCGDVVDNIGGNLGAAAAPLGYLSPGVAGPFGERPYAGAPRISGLFGTGTNIDYYEFEWAASPAGPWSPMPPAAAGGFTRRYFEGPSTFQGVPFSFTPIDGRLVIQSRERYEADNPPPAGTWGFDRIWVENRDLLMQWLTATTFADGTYYLRLLGYTEAAGTLGAPQILPLCGSREDNGLVLTIDNSTSALEPAADIVDVRIAGASAEPCSNITAPAGAALEVDFIAYDEDAHLSEYSLIATFGKTESVDLLAVAGASLTPLAIGATPAADYVGPGYGAALGQGAASPHWRAGGLRLTIPDLRDAFKRTCCYQLELRVYKRSLVSCVHPHRPEAYSFYSLTVVV